jgi:RNA polymerase sigma-70 factor (ECF subfamily)
MHNDRLAILWQQVLEGDTTALKQIHNELFDGLYNYALKVVQDEDVADDAVQELFIKLWTKRSSIGNLEKVKQYFFSSLRRQLLNELRNLNLRQLKIKAIKEPDIEFSPEEILIKAEHDQSIKAKLLEMLSLLPERQKEVIYLHYFQNLDYSEIALIMEINYQSVLNHAQKAIQKLRSDFFILLIVIAFFYFI